MPGIVNIMSDVCAKFGNRAFISEFLVIFLSCGKFVKVYAHCVGKVAPLQPVCKPELLSQQSDILARYSQHN